MGDAMSKWERQAILAIIGGGCLGKQLGAVLAAIAETLDMTSVGRHEPRRSRRSS